MLAVLLTFLGASLAFAQYLVVHKQTPSLFTTRLAPFGFSTPTEPTLPDEIEAYVGTIAKRLRRVDIFSWQLDESPDIDEQAALASGIFMDVTNTAPEETITARLAGILGIEVRGSAPDNRFAIVRLAVVDDHAFAICYSGGGPCTDADRIDFAGLCASGVRIGK